MKHILTLVLGFLLVAAPVFAHDADGKWEGSVDTPMGAIPVGFTFKTDGALLSGTSLTPDGGEVAIKAGKVEGNKIAFTVEIDFGGMGIVLDYVGTVSPNEIQFMGDFMGMPFEFVVKKAK